MSDRLVALFAVRFPEDISGLDDPPFNGDRDAWLKWLLESEGPELTAINSLCDQADVEFYGWMSEEARA